MVHLFESKWEIVLFQLSGFDVSVQTINGVTAYISALLIGTLIVHYLINNHMKLFINLLAPLMIIFIYSHIINIYGNLSQWVAYENWYCIGIFRAIAGLSTGVLTFYLLNKVIKRFSNKVYIFLNIMCIICLILLVTKRYSITYRDEIAYIFIFSLLISVNYVRVEFSTYCNKFIFTMCIYLGKLSYSIFLIHYIICQVFKRYLGNKGYGKMIIPYLVIVIISALMIDFVENKLSKIVYRFYQRHLRRV